MKAKVLYISYDGMTDPLGQSQVIPYLQGLSAEGYRITLLSFEKKMRFGKQSAYIRSLLEKSGIDWKPQYFTKHPPFLSKIYDVWRLKSITGRLYRKEKFDFVHCRSYVSASAGLRLYKKYNVPFLFDMRGFWVDERVDNGQWNLKNPFFRFFYARYKKKEKTYFVDSHHIISLTWKGRDELIQAYGVPADKITVIPCCVDLEHFDYKKIPATDIQKKKEELGIKPGESVITYLGSLGGWYLEKEMLEFFNQMKKDGQRVKFLFITQDPDTKIINAAAASGITVDDIIIQPATRNEVPLYLSLSNWSIFFIKDAYSKKASSPTKQGEIMAMGIPLVCNDIGDTGKIVETSASGVLIHSFTGSEYKRAAEEMATLSKLNRETIRSAAMEYYDLQKGLQSYSRVYKLMQESSIDKKTTS